MRLAPKSSTTSVWLGGLRMAFMMTLSALSATAHATDYNEGPVVGGPDTPHETNDLSSVASTPTYIGALTLGSNYITGATIPYGPVLDPMTGARQNQDNDYVTFTVPTGDKLTDIFLDAPPVTNPLPPSPDGTVIQPGDLFFVGIADGSSVNVTPPSSAGLLGYTLVSSSMIGSDILDDLGMSAPPGFSGPPFTGATTFTGALSAGTYSLWLLDGDNPVYYKLALNVAAVPEPTSWMMMLAGFAAIGVARRRRAGRIACLAA